jgi:hypothetical protein
MLPACRTAGDGFAIPTFDVVPSDVEGFLEARWEWQSTLHDGFARREPRVHFCDSMVGQCSKLARKSIEPMALQVEGGTIRGLQRLLSARVWDEEQRRWNYHPLVAEARGDPDGVLRFDETGCVKKGTDSVGVARQDCGTLGKGAHGQGGGGPARRHGRGRPSWRSGGSCLQGGGLTRRRPAVPRATCPPPSRVSANPSWRQPW